MKGTQNTMTAIVGLVLAQAEPTLLQDAGEIGKILLLVAAVAAGMQQVLGSTIQAQVESLQASGLVDSKFGGVAAMIVGIVYGLGLGLVAYFSTDVNALTLLVSGILGGLVAGGAAITVDQRIDGQMARKLERMRSAEAVHAETMLELETKREAARAEQVRLAHGAGVPAPELLATIVAGEPRSTIDPATQRLPAPSINANSPNPGVSAIPATKTPFSRSDFGDGG
jgi:hypothetical protein